MSDKDLNSVRAFPTTSTRSCEQLALSYEVQSLSTGYSYMISRFCTCLLALQSLMQRVLAEAIGRLEEIAGSYTPTAPICPIQLAVCVYKTGIIAFRFRVSKGVPDEPDKSLQHLRRQNKAF